MSISIPFATAPDSTSPGTSFGGRDLRRLVPFALLKIAAGILQVPNKSTPLIIFGKRISALWADVAIGLGR